MTPDQHRRIGALLGFPSCCVEAWVRGETAAMSHGSILVRERTPEEADAINAEVSAMLGREWTGAGAMQYVPCPAHVGAPGWAAFGRQPA